MGGVAKSVFYINLFFSLLEGREEQVLNFRHADLAKQNPFGNFSL